MKNFCSQPWVGIDISPLGDFKPCCKFRDESVRGFQEYLSSDLLDEVRQSFLRDERHPGCIRCWKDEDAGIPSKRIMDDRMDPADIDSDLFKTVSLTFGNTCNLACRTCGSHSSSRWLQEIKSHGNYRDDILYKHDKFYKDLGLWDDIADKLIEGAQIDISGGEVFLSDIKEHAYFLSLLEGKTALTTLKYTTNGTFFPEDAIIERWTKFKSVRVQISVDGVGKMFEYTRWPGVWSKFYENIQRYKQLSAEHPHIELSLSHTVSVFNILDIPDFLMWCMKEKLPSPWMGMVYQPSEYSIRSLPKPIKREITARLEKLGDRISSVLTYMNNEDLPDSHFQNLLPRIEFLDKHRNQSFDEACPRIAELIKKAH